MSDAMENMLFPRKYRAPVGTTKVDRTLLGYVAQDR